MAQEEKLVILGSGPAGLTAAIYAARAKLEPLVLAGALPGGLLTRTTEVENFPGFPEGVQGVDLMMQLQSQAERFGARIEYAAATACRLTDGGSQGLTLEDGRELAARALIVATGASPRWLGLPAEERLRNHGVSACATCDGAFFAGLPVAVVGGGDSAMEEALFLSRFASHVYVIVRRDVLRASAVMGERARSNDKLEFLWNSEVVDLLGEQALEQVRVRNRVSGEERVLDCRGFFPALGHQPDTELFRGQLELDEAGYIRLPDSGTSRTSLAGVFAAGDCADSRYRQAITAAGMGCRAAIDAERYLA